MTAIKSGVTTTPSSLAFFGFLATRFCSRICMRVVRAMGLMGIMDVVLGTELADEVGTTDAAQALLDVAALLGLIPEEILSLRQFLVLTLGTLYRF